MACSMSMARLGGRFVPNLPSAHWALGYPAQAVQTMERTLAHARALAHPYSIAITLLFAAQLSQLRRVT